MNYATALLPLVLLLPGCASNRWDRDPEDLDEGLLSQVTDEEYRAINEARAALPERRDRVAFAERELELAKRDRDLVEHELDEVEVALDEALERAGARRDAQVDAEETYRDIEEAHAYRRWVESRIRQRDAEIEAAKAKVEVREAELALGEAHVELLEAEALSDVPSPEVDDLDVGTYRIALHRREAELADASADMDAARARVEVLERLVTERSQAVPARYRTIDEDVDRDVPEPGEAVAEREKELDDG
jgi:hypothetical protein